MGLQIACHVDQGYGKRYKMCHNIYVFSHNNIGIMAHYVELMEMHVALLIPTASRSDALPGVLASSFSSLTLWATRRSTIRVSLSEVP